MAVRIINEAAFDAKFDAESDRIWKQLNKDARAKSKDVRKRYDQERDELINKYNNEDPFNDNAFSKKEVDKDTELVIDKITGKLLYNKIGNLIKSMGFKIDEAEYNENENDLAKVAKEAIGKQKSEYKVSFYDSRIRSRASKILKFTLSKNGKVVGNTIQNRCDFEISLFIRRALLIEKGKPQELFEAFLLSNIPGYIKFMEKNEATNEFISQIYKEYKEISDALSNAPILAHTQEYWDLNEEDNFNLDEDVFPIKENNNKKSK